MWVSLGEKDTYLFKCGINSLHAGGHFSGPIIES